MVLGKFFPSTFTCVVNKFVNLGYLPLRNDKVTVSGTSAGGAMAMALYLSHSKLFSGVAIFSGGIYRTYVYFILYSKFLIILIFIIVFSVISLR